MIMARSRTLRASSNDTLGGYPQKVKASVQISVVGEFGVRSDLSLSQKHRLRPQAVLSSKNGFHLSSTTTCGVAPTSMTFTAVLGITGPTLALPSSIDSSYAWLSW